MSDAMVETIREVRQEIGAYMDFASQVSALAVRLAERADPVALDLLALMRDLDARTSEFEMGEETG